MPARQTTCSAADTALRSGSRHEHQQWDDRTSDLPVSDAAADAEHDATAPSARRPTGQLPRQGRQQFPGRAPFNPHEYAHD